MSGDKGNKKAGGRFAGQLASLAGRPTVTEQIPDQPESGAAQPEAVKLKSDDDLETFSSHMTKGRKRRLKFAAIKEDRNMYEIVGELVEAYLSRNHPDLK